MTEFIIHMSKSKDENETIKYRVILNIDWWINIKVIKYGESTYTPFFVPSVHLKLFEMTKMKQALKGKELVGTWGGDDG